MFISRVQTLLSGDTNAITLIKSLCAGDTLKRFPQICSLSASVRALPDLE